MKRKNLLLLLPVLAMTCTLQGCGDTSSDTNTTGTTTDKGTTDNTSNTTVKKDYTVDDLYARIYELARGNFQLNYAYGDKEYSDIYNENYCYYGSTEQGYVILDSYDGASQDKIAYRFAYYEEDTEDSYKLCSTAYYYDENDKLQIGSSTHNFDYLTYLADKPNLYSFEKGAIEKDGDDFYVTSYYAEQLFSYTFHAAAYFNYGYVNRLLFRFDDNGDLYCAVQGKVDQIRHGNIIAGTFTDVGKAKNDFIDVAFGDQGYKLPSEKPSEAALAILKSDELTIDGKINYHNPSSTTAVDTDEGNVTNIYGKDFVYNEATNASEYEVNYNYVYKKDGVTYEKYVDATNAVVEKKTEKKVEDYTPLKDVLQYDAIRKVGDEYMYFGTNLNEVIDALFGVTNSYKLFTYLGGVTFTENNGVIDKVKFYYGDYFNPGDDNSYFEIAADLKAEAKAPVIKSYAASTDEKVNTALSKFDGSKAYRIKLYNDADNNSLYTANYYLVADYDPSKKAVYIKEYEYDKVVKEYGYLDSEEGMVEFEKVEKEDGTSYYQKTTLPDASKDAFKNKALFNLSADVLMANSSNKNAYIFKGRVDGFGKLGIIDTEGESQYGYTASTTFNFEGTDTASYQLKNMVYSYYPKGGNTTHKMELDFFYGDDYKIKEDLSVMKDYKQPTSWEEEDETFASRLQALFGEDSSKVPYLFDRSLNKNFKFKYTSTSVTFYSRVEGKEDYLAKYVALLKEKGFKAVEGKEDTYQLGTVQAVVGKTLKNGVTFTKVNA